MTVRTYESAAAVASAAAGAIASAIAARPGLVLGLPTGNTPVATYAALRARSIDWSGVRTFNLDEFVGLPGSDPRSYRAFMEEHLFGAVNLPPAQVHFLDGTAADLDAECRRYEAAIDAAGGIDLLVCGVGQNGHVAFNEPGPALQAPTHVATLLEPTRQSNVARFGHLSAVPALALTVGMATLLHARRLLVLATGPAKARAVAAMHHGPLTPQVPASWLQVHPAVDVLLDRDAASELTA